MEALGSVFSTIANGLGKVMPAMSGGTGSNLLSLMGMGENIFSKIMQYRKMSQAAAQQKRIMDLVNNPSKLAGLVASAEQPLSQGLTRTVTDQTLANLAQRGLNPQTAPGQSQEAVAEALAPYQMQEQARATQMIMQTLGLPFEQAMALAQAWGGEGGDNSNIWSQFLKPAPITPQTNTPIPGGPLDPNNPQNTDPGNPPVLGAPDTTFDPSLIWGSDVTPGMPSVPWGQ